MIGFGYSVVTLAINQILGNKSSLNLDFAATGTLDPRITFRRTSNATVTGSNGLIQYAPHNLLTYSEQFDNAAWTKTRSTVLANFVVSPDGTMTADKLIEDTTAANSHFTINTVPLADTTVHTFSVYLKASERTWARLTVVDKAAANIGTYFNLADGTIGSSTAGSTPVITPISNGWYRCSVSVNSSTGATQPQFRIWLANSDGGITYTGDGTSGVYLWGAQLEIGSTATAYNSTTVKNLLGYTQEFDNAAWTKSSYIVYPNVTIAPDGSKTADKICGVSGLDPSAQNATGVTQALVTTAGVPYNYSVYAKAAELSVLRYRDGGVSGAFLSVDLLTGIVTNGNPSRFLNVNVESLADGWYRVSFTSPSITNANLYPFRAAGNIGDDTSGIYIWGAQLSDSASVDPYVYNPVAAPTPAAYYGPRFDYDPVTLAPKGLLIEEQRTNLLLQSQNFGTSWNNTNSSESVDVAVSPDGTQNADKLIVNNGATVGGSQINQIVSKLAVATTYAFSVFGQAAGLNRMWLIVSDASSFSNRANFAISLVDGAVTIAAGSVGTFTEASGVVTAFKDGWYRASLTFTSSTETSVIARIYPLDSSITTGDGVKGINIWGAQLEAGAFATSYIPTVASQVTRAADNASMIGANFSNWYNQSEGTLYAEWASAESGNGDILNVSDGTANNFISTFKQAATLYTQYVVTGGSLSVSQARSQTYPVGTFYKNSLAYKASDFASTVNGGSVSTTLSGTVPTVSRINVGMNATGLGEHINGTIKRIAYYPRRLANSELQAITA